MVNVIVKGRAIDENVVKKHSDKATEEQLLEFIHGGLEGEGGITKPNDITLYS